MHSAGSQIVPRWRLDQTIRAMDIGGKGAAQPCFESLVSRCTAFVCFLRGPTGGLDEISIFTFNHS